MFFSRRVNVIRPSCLRRLLVVEDDALLAFDHEHALSAAGYDVVATVNCGESAVAVLTQSGIDGIVLDLNIAGNISGAEVARLAHQQGMVVLIVSADAPGSAADHAAAHLAKPLANGALVSALRALETKLRLGKEPGRVAGLTMLATP